MISSLVISSLVDAAGVDEGGVHVIECKEFVPTTLGLMDACNEDDRNSVCAYVCYLVWLSRFEFVLLPCCLVLLPRPMSFFDVFSRCNVSLYLALLAPRSAAYCPF